MGETRTMLKAVLLLACLYMAGAQANSAVIFPGDSSGQPSHQQVAPVGNNRQTGIGNKPRCADGLEENAPCIDDQDYTTNIRDRFRFLLGRFRGNEIVTNEVFQDLSKPDEINVTIDNGIRDEQFTFEPLCASRETIIYPKRAKTQKNEWVFVLSQGKHRQAVKVEKCSNNNGPCRLGAARTEVNTVCRQKYIYKKLLVMNGAGTDIVPESVLMPSCCVCYIRTEDDGFFADLRTSISQKNETTTPSMHLDSDKEDNLITEMSTMEETTLAPTTDKETQPIIFKIEE